jgi:hypothetical protein
MIVGYSEYTSQWKRLYETILSYIPGGKHTFIMNPQRCDIFFCSYGDIHKASHYNNCKTVFISGEPQPVKDNRIDVLLDCKLMLNLRPLSVPAYFMPFYALSFMERNNHTPQTLIKPPSYDPKTILKSKTKFCAFQYRYSIPHRDALFDTLSRYKQVDAIGKAKNKNPHFQYQGKSPYDDSVRFYQPYKFVICCENHSYPGYVTEKIVNAMLANSIPIYWGAPDIVKHFNPESFINTSDPKWFEKVRLLDQNDELYCKMLSKPWLHNNQISEYLNLPQQFKTFATMISKGGGRKYQLQRHQFPQHRSLGSRRNRSAIPYRSVVSSATPLRHFTQRRPQVSRSRSKSLSSQTRRFVSPIKRRYGRRR